VVSTLNVEVMLDQRGGRVTGSLRAYGPIGRPVGGPVEGSVAGDVLQFQQTDGRLRGDATVNGDEMTGRFVLSGVPPEGRLVLRRVDRAALPPVTRP
jgi:hypothetical protein